MLKAAYEVLQHSAGNSFLLRVFGEIAFTAPYHFHPEYELTLILQGSGKRYVGSHMADFRSGDLVLVGSHLPHCWKLEGENTKGSTIVIQFAPDFLGAGFFSRAGLAPIANLLERSGCGIQFSQKTQEYLLDSMLALAGEIKDFRKLIKLLEILHELALAKDSVLLDSRRITAELSQTDRERAHPVFAYLVENFRGDISLDRAAAIAGMTPNAFCRYFKKITRKTFMETVIEYRLNHATQQLIQTDKPVSAICFDSGFGDISHFYKMFRSKTQLSPLNYRKKFIQETHSAQHAADAFSWDHPS
ncbi:MAG TPA: AraC family transcriptional regulator [Puia sp.]|nr:AraC family transcriptional regulator [Puia sp.]